MTALVAAGAVIQAWGVLAEATPSPTPSVQEIPSAEQTSPGLIGFLVTFAVAVAVMLLAYSLVRKLRVVERRGQHAERERDAQDTDAETSP